MGSEELRPSLEPVLVAHDVVDRPANQQATPAEAADDAAEQAQMPAGKDDVAEDVPQEAPPVIDADGVVHLTRTTKKGG